MRYDGGMDELCSPAMVKRLTRMVMPQVPAPLYADDDEATARRKLVLEAHRYGEEMHEERG